MVEVGGSVDGADVDEGADGNAAGSGVDDRNDTEKVAGDGDGWESVADLVVFGGTVGNVVGGFVVFVVVDVVVVGIVVVDAAVDVVVDVVVVGGEVGLGEGGGSGSARRSIGAMLAQSPRWGAGLISSNLHISW